MDNPLNLPAPTDPLERVHAFARDLAYGVAQGWWSTQFDIRGNDKLDVWHFDQTLEDVDEQVRFLIAKWTPKYPARILLETFGYLEYRLTRDSPRYILTEKAMRLLEKPAAPPSVFISYKRDQSSAFALLVEARLRLAGNPNPFVDKNIVAGDEWRERLHTAIQQSKYFVCLIGEKTLESEWVRQEINWAAESGCTLISIWHGRKMGDDCPAALRDRNAITVTGESAREYETAISQLLNALGYATY